MLLEASARGDLEDDARPCVDTEESSAAGGTGRGDLGELKLALRHIFAMVFVENIEGDFFCLPVLLTDSTSDGSYAGCGEVTVGL